MRTNVSPIVTSRVGIIVVAVVIAALLCPWFWVELFGWVGLCEPTPRTQVSRHLAAIDETRLIPPLSA